MTFSDVMTAVDKWAARAGLPAYFGDEYVRNHQANAITGDFIFWDVPGGSLAKKPSHADMVRMK